MNRFIEQIKNEKNITQVIYLTAAGFFAILCYPFTRTSAAPFFNAAYGADNLPYAMMASALMAVAVVVIYNELAKRFRLVPLCIYALVFIIAVTTAFGFIMGKNPPWVALLYYAWSDVYILIIVEQFWSISNTIFDKETAKRYYGLFLTAGALGGLFGNYIVMWLAESVGSVNMIFLSSFAMSVFAYTIAGVNTTIKKRDDLTEKFEIEREIADRSFVGGLTLVARNRYLLYIALLIVATQLYINAAYFLYNQRLDASVKLIDSQSALYGEIFLIIQIVTIVMSLVLTPLVLRVLGLAKTHLSIVGTVALIFIITVLQPQLALLAMLFIAAKSFDYSIFRAAKEIFYLPLHVAEKFQAKAFIDVFVYRLSKAIAAFGILFITKIISINVFYLVAAGIVLWFVLIWLILRIYRRKYQPY